MTSKTRFVVRCEDWESQRFAARGSAADKAAALNVATTCNHVHEVHEVAWLGCRWVDVEVIPAP